MPTTLLFLLSYLSLVAALFDQPPAIHYTLERRGGAFAPNWTANLTYLSEQLKIAESRFNFTRREVKGNKIVRVPKEKAVGGGDVTKLMGEYGRPGNWFAKMKLGSPIQKIEMDIDMLTKDFAITTTSSNLGSRFEDFFSSTYTQNAFGIIPFPNCAFPHDLTLLPSANLSFDLQFAHCKPRRQSRDTLLPSGALLGLAPSKSLSQLGDELPDFFDQLVGQNIVENDVFSLHLINGEEGILSIGGTIADAIARVEERIEGFLGKPHDYPVAEHIPDPEQDAQDYVNGASEAQRAANADKGQAVPPQGQAFADKGQAVPPQIQKRDLEEVHDPHMEKRAALEDANAILVPTWDDLSPVNRAGRAKPKGPTQPTWRDGWKWSPVEGAAGWWQILMRGIWADQVKIMKNQPCIIDINTPFILAPPLAAKAFYASISGAHRLPSPYSNFWAYPCNNPPFLHFEFGGWRFPVMRGTKSSYEHRGANGKFSLGKVAEDSGYCVGAVVESRMGVGDVQSLRKSGRSGSGAGGGRDTTTGESGIVAGNGLRDVWILGEPVFRGMGLVFDMEAKEVGFRSY